MGGRNSGGGGRPGIKRSMMARQSSLGDEDGLDLEVEAEAEAEAAASKGSSDSGIGDFEDATSGEDSGESTGWTLQGEEYVRLLKFTSHLSQFCSSDFQNIHLLYWGPFLITPED